MKHLIRLSMIAMLAIGITACDNILLPEHPGGGRGGTEDSTGTGDRDTSGNEDRDWGRDTLIIGGPILVNVPGANIDPEQMNVVVAWNNGRGEQVVFGQGEVTREGRYWQVIITESLPEEFLFAPEVAIGGTIETGIHGMGTVHITNEEFRDGSVMPYQMRMGPFELYGELQPFKVFYYTGREKFTEWASPWIEEFPVGYSVGIPAFMGYVPVMQPEYPISIQVR